MFWFGKKKKLQKEQIEEQVVETKAPEEEVVPAFAIAVPEESDEVVAEAPVEASPEASEEVPVPAEPVTEAPAEPEQVAEVPAEPVTEVPAEPEPVPAPAPAEQVTEPAPAEEAPLEAPEQVTEAPAEQEPPTEPTPAPAEPVTEAPVEPAAPVEPTPAPAEQAPAVPAQPEPPVEPASAPAEQAPAAPAQPEPPAQPDTPRVTAQAVPETYTPTQEEIDARLPAREPEPRYGHGLGFLIFLLMLAIGGAYYYGRVYSEDHYFHGTYVNGIDVSNMTVKEAEAEFEKRVKDYHIDLTFRGGETETIKGSEIDYHYWPDGSLHQIMASQDTNWWFLGFFQKREAQIAENKKFDEELLRQAVLALPELQESNMILPTDAYIVYQEDGYAITPHSEGTLVDVQMVADAVVEAVREESQAVDVEALGAYAAPAVRSDDEDLVAYRDQLNDWIAGSITYYLPDGGEMSLDGSVTKEWLSVDEDGRLYKDDDVWEEKIEIFVDNLAMRVNTVGESRSFKSTNAGTITMNGGDYGYSVNKPAEREAIAELFEEGESDDREPMFYTREYGDDHSINDGIGDTYIEANLSSQHVWIYVDGKMVCESDCVSGNVNQGRGTPTGVYQILYKDTDVELKGQPLANGKYSYISHVNYWMPFYSGCGFHDADWRTQFGGNIYRTDGSHGCINLPKEIAPKFYNFVSKGMPVVVYY